MSNNGKQPLHKDTQSLVSARWRLRSSEYIGLFVCFFKQKRVTKTNYKKIWAIIKIKNPNLPLIPISSFSTFQTRFGSFGIHRVWHLLVQVKLLL